MSTRATCNKPQNLFRCWRAALALLMLFALPGTANAARSIVVGDGTSASCTESALRSALEAAETSGGTIRFRCGKEPVTISLTFAVQDPTYGLVALNIPDDTTIDGGGLITLEGAQAAVSLLIGPDAHVALSNLTMAGGSFRADLIRNAGKLTIENNRFSTSVEGHSAFSTGRINNDGELIVQSGVFSGLRPIFALFLNNGILTINDSAFVDNQAGHSVIENHGALDVKNSAFSGSRGGSAGVILSREGGTTLTVDNSDFVDSRGNTGAAVINTQNPTIIKNSTFSDNFGSERGAISAGSALTVIHCKFLNNFSQSHGGAIVSSGPLEVVNSEISGNRAATWGGGIAATGTVTITNSTITNNIAGWTGGGIHITNGAPTLIRTTVADNTPDDIFIWT